MLIVELVLRKIVARETVALRRCVVVVQVGGDRVDPETAIIRRQVVNVPDQDRLAVRLVIGGARTNAVKPPNGLQGELRRHIRRAGLLGNLIEDLRG